MIEHASIYSTSDVAGLKVLVMRYWPRGVRRERVDVWIKDAAPSRELLRAYAHEGLPWAEFEQRYRDETLHERPEVLERLRGLQEEHGALTLLCHERIPPKEHCHRTVLLELLTASRGEADAGESDADARERNQAFQSRLDARRAPSARASSLAHMMLGCWRRMP